MYEAFTNRARKVLQLSNQEAQRFNHEYIGTEHVLLGLLKEGSGVAANVLRNLDIDLRKIRLEVEKLVQSGPEMVTMGRLPQTLPAKKVLEYAIDEARNLKHNHVGTEHLLLGLLREDEGVAAQVLMNLGLKLPEVRAEVLNELNGGVASTWIDRGGCPPRPPSLETKTLPSAETVRVEQAVPGSGKAMLPDTGVIVSALAWIFLGLGIVGLVVGSSQGREFTLPGAILIGGSLIALALRRR
ncbi:MAG TPA: Clp protease N-terminal domain-containing protein [Pirellulales bacterium]|nr:Clp protease N-terminal domain-containing protein [Pirellulales bacterium]